MKWVAIIISIVFALGFLFVAMAAVAAFYLQVPAMMKWRRMS